MKGRKGVGLAQTPYGRRSRPGTGSFRTRAWPYHFPSSRSTSALSSTLAIALHLVEGAAGFHGAPAAALILAGIEKQPSARGGIGAATKPRGGRIAKQVQRIEHDA